MDEAEFTRRAIAPSGEGMAGDGPMPRHIPAGQAMGGFRRRPAGSGAVPR